MFLSTQKEKTRTTHVSQTVRDKYTGRSRVKTNTRTYSWTNTMSAGGPNMNSNML